MKKVILLGLFAISSYALKAQSISGIPIKDIDVEYLEIEYSGGYIFYNFGHIDKAKIDTVKMVAEYNVVKDVDGKVLKFHSGIDALNFMSKNGFDLVTAYATQNGIHTNQYYLMRNKKFKGKD